MMNFEDFKEVKIENCKKVSGGGNYTASHTRGGRHVAMDYENDDCTLDVWYDDGSKETLNCV